MKHIRYILFLLVINNINCLAQSSNAASFELWDINSLTSIGGHTVTVSGNPVVVDTDMGQAVKFDGNGDMLTVNSAPVGSATEFTVEVIFKPDAGSLNIVNMPRFLCFWDPNDANGPRMTIELRVKVNTEWYFDGFLKTDLTNLPLMDTTKTHATGQWMHAAVVYKNKTLTTYVNGIQELTGPLGYTTKALNVTGKVSIGARYNLTNWYSGIIKTIKVTQSALLPEEFIVNTIPTSIQFQTKIQDKVKIFPNPANNNLYFELNGIETGTPVNISLYSIVGREILNLKTPFANNNTISLNVGNIKDGIYFAKIRNGRNLIAREISINHNIP